MASAKDVDHVDITRHTRDAAIYALAENLGHFGIIDRHWNDLESGALGVGRYKVPGLFRIDLDAENRNATRLVNHASNLLIVVDEMPPPIVVVL